MEVTFALGEHMLLLAGVAVSKSDARAMLERCIVDGTALAKFRAMVAAQGGDVAVVDDVTKLPRARLQVPLMPTAPGFVVKVGSTG